MTSAANAERASLYSGREMTGAIFPHERVGSTYKGIGDGGSVRSGLWNHGRQDSLTGSIGQGQGQSHTRDGAAASAGAQPGVSPLASPSLGAGSINHALAEHDGVMSEEDERAKERQEETEAEADGEDTFVDAKEGQPKISIEHA